MINTLLRVLFFLIPAAAAQAAFIHNPSLDWYSLESPHFHVHFHNGNDAIAERVVNIAEQVHSKLVPYFDWQPDKPTQVVLVSRVDFANGFSTALPRNTMVLLLTESDSFGDDYDDWLMHLITHEYTHILHLDKARGAPKNLRNLFGRFLFLFPNMLQPIWVAEGLATHVRSVRSCG